MQVCGTCGAVTSRLTVIFEVDGRPLPEPKDTCPYCDGSRDAVHSTTDRKLWLGHEAYAEHYDKTYTPEGQIVYKASDSLIADLMDEWQKDPDEEANRQLKAHAQEWKRNHPDKLTPAEIESMTNRIREVVNQGRALDAGLILPI